MSGLSVLCITRDPGPQVQAVLAPLRDVADEIVVVADSRVPRQDLDHYGAASDRLLRYEFAPPVERPYAWAHAQCRGDWVLRVDGDEYLSPELVARLPQLVARRDLLQCWIPRRWSYPDARHWIDEQPWAPDFQIRLVRNDPATLSFPGRMHTAARPVLPCALLEEPMYHLDLLIHGYEERLAKAARYEALRPGMTVMGGGPMEMFYLPEQWVARRPSSLPRAHRDGVGSILEPPHRFSPDGAPRPDVVTREEIDRHWEGRSLEREDYVADIQCLDRDLRLAPGAIGELTIRVRNRGRATWPGGSERQPLVQIGHRWRSVEGDLLTDVTPRTPLAGALEGGASAVARLVVTAPEQVGRYCLEVDLVHEDVRWFDSSVQIQISVGDRPTATPPAARPRRLFPRRG